MSKATVKDTGLFSTHMPQTHARDVADRQKVGKALRKRTPRKRHAGWKPLSNRRDPVE